MTSITVSVVEATRSHPQVGIVTLGTSERNALGVDEGDPIVAEGIKPTVVTVVAQPQAADEPVAGLDWLARRNAGAPHGTEVTLQTLTVGQAEDAHPTSVNTHCDAATAADMLVASDTDSPVVTDGDLLYLAPTQLAAEDDRGLVFEVEAIEPSSPARVTGDTRLTVEPNQLIKGERGILSPGDRAYLACRRYLEASSSEEKTSTRDHSEVRERIRERVTRSLADFGQLLRHLSDEDLEEIFDDEEYAIRSAVQDALVFLLLGLEANGDDLAFRSSEAISHAHFAHGRHATVDIDVVTEDFPPGEVLLERFQEDGLAGFTHSSAYDQLLRDPSIDPETLVAAHQSADWTADEAELKPEDFHLEKLLPELQARSLPAATLLNVEVSQESGTETDTDR